MHFQVNIKDFHENFTSEVCFPYNLNTFILEKIKMSSKLLKGC